MKAIITRSLCRHQHVTMVRRILIAVVASSLVGAFCTASDILDEALQTYLSANGLLNRGLYELAVPEYRKFLAVDPEHEKVPVARYGLAVSLFRSGKTEPAVAELKELRKLSGFEFAAEVGAILGKCHLAAGRFVPAAEAFEYVARQFRNHDLADDAAAGAIEALYGADRFGEAVEMALLADQHWPDSKLRNRWEFFCGLSEMARNQYPAAAKRFSAMLQRSRKGPLAEHASLLLARCFQHDNAVDKAIAQYQKVIAHAQSRFVPDALLALGLLLHREGRSEEAGRHVDHLIERFPKSQLLAEGYQMRGRIWFNQKNYDRAIGAFERAAASSDHSDESAYWTAKCQLRKGEFAEAARRLKSAARKFPKSSLLPEMLYDRAVALLSANKLDASVKGFTDFRSRFPEHSMAADALQLMALAEHRQHHYDRSQQHCQEFLGTYANHRLAPSLAFLAGENEYIQGHLEEAVDRFRRFLQRYPDDAQAGKAKFRLGTALFRLDRFEHARLVLDEVARLSEDDPTFRSALLALGDIHFQRSEWKKAAIYLDRYLSDGLDVPSGDDALLKLGLARERMGRSAEALRDFTQLIERFEESPHKPHAMFERGQVLLELARPDEAVEAFETLLAENPNSRFSTHALNQLALMATKRKDFDRAAQLYERVAGTSEQKEAGAEAMLHRAQALMSGKHFADAAAAYAQFLDLHPKHDRAIDASAQRAIALARLGKHADALSVMAGMERGSISDLEPALAEALHYEKAWCLRQTGRLDEATKAYRSLTGSQSQGRLTTYALLELGMIEADAGRYESAAALLRRLTSMLPPGSGDDLRKLREQAVYRLGICEFELGRFEQAVELLVEFVDEFTVSPLVASASYYCGEAMIKLGKFARAASYLQRVAAEFEGDAVFAPSLLRLGECHAALQRWVQSERVLSEYLTRFSGAEQWYQAQFGVGWARENQKRYSEALDAYGKVVSRHKGPTAARAQFQIGECLFAQKQYERAIRALLRVDILYAYPKWSAAALFEAGRCFRKLNKTAEATDQFRQVTERFEDMHWAPMAAQRLSELSRVSLPGR